MGDRKHAPKRGAQNINNSLTNSPVIKSVQSKIPKRNDTKEVKEEEKDENVKEMFEIIMSKLGKLDIT
jgi:copper chaperone CopZ